MAPEPVAGPVTSTRNFYADKVVAQDPNAVLAELERRQRLANLSGD